METTEPPPPLPDDAPLDLPRPRRPRREFGAAERAAMDAAPSPTAAADDPTTEKPTGPEGPTGPDPAALLARLEEEERRFARGRRVFLSWLLGIALVGGSFVWIAVREGTVSLKGVAQLGEETPRLREMRERQERRAARLGKAKNAPDAGLPRGFDVISLDLSRYLHEDLPALRAEEKRALAPYYDVLTRRAADDPGAAARVIRAEALPEYRLYLEHAYAVELATPEAWSLHKLLLEAARQRLSALESMTGADSPARGDAWRGAAYRRLAEVRNIDAKFDTRLAELRARHPAADTPPPPRPKPSHEPTLEDKP